MIRNDRSPVTRTGYEPTGEGRYAECPDHGVRLWWSEARNLFFCPANDGHPGEPYELAPADIYLEHDEAWRVVNGCLYVDTYDSVEDDHECSAVDTPDGGIYCQECGRFAVHVLHYGWQHENGEAHADAVERAGLDSTLRTGEGRPYSWSEVSEAFTRNIRGL